MFLSFILGSRQVTQGRCQVVTPPPRFGFRRKLVRGSYNAPMLIDDRKIMHQNYFLIRTLITVHAEAVKLKPFSG